MDYFPLRSFGAQLATFLSVDPDNAGASLLTPQSWSGYTYVVANPFRFVDPTGGEPCQYDVCVTATAPPDIGVLRDLIRLTRSVSNVNYDPALYGTPTDMYDMPNNFTTQVQYSTAGGGYTTTPAGGPDANHPWWSLSPLEKIWMMIKTYPKVGNVSVPIIPFPGQAGIGVEWTIIYNHNTGEFCVGLGVSVGLGFVNGGVIIDDNGKIEPENPTTLENNFEGPGRSVSAQVPPVGVIFIESNNNIYGAVGTGTPGIAMSTGLTGCDNINSIPAYFGIQ